MLGQSEGIILKMKFLLPTLVLLTAGSSRATGNSCRKKGKRCNFPLDAVLKTMECIEAENAECSAAGYNPDFVKKHNGIVANNTAGIHTPDYWQGAFTLVDLLLDINYESEDKQAETQQVNLRYVESVITTDGTDLALPPSSTFPFNQTLFQYEHAIVTVDSDCKMLEWDQYGDNAEQVAVDVVVGAILGVLNGA